MPLGFEYEAAPAEFMYMPAGTHTITAFRGGKPTTVTVVVDAGTASALNGTLKAYESAGPHKPFLDFNHEGGEASAWPREFIFKDADGGKPAGVYCRCDWTKPGLDAIQGKSFRAFSPEFFLDKYVNDPKNPSRVTSAPLAMGGLVNKPAFRAISPLWAREAGEQGAGSGEPEEIISAGESAATETNKQKDTQMKENGTAVAATAATDNDSAIKAKDAKIVELETALQASQAAVKAHNKALADTAVKAAVARGALPAQDKAIQAKYASLIESDPSNVVLLETLPGNQAVQGRASSHARIEVVREDPATAVKAYDGERNASMRGGIYQREFMPLMAKGEMGAALQAYRRQLTGDAVQATNSFGTLVSNIISQRVLELLRFQLPGLNRITTDFSDEQVKYGQGVVSRYNGIPTVGTYNTGTGYPVISTAASTDVTVTINQHKCVELALNAEELSGTPRRLFDEQAPAMAYALAKDLIDYVYALITAANFTETATAAAAVDFGRSVVIDIAKALTDRGVPLGSQFRTLLLNTEYFAALAKDNTIVTLAAYQQANIITEGNLPNVHGFQVVEAPNLPTTGSLTGFGMSKSALVGATRLPIDYTSILPGASNGAVSTIKDPDSGASCLQTLYVNHTLGTANMRLAWMYGAAKGQIKAGQLLTS
jgi:hypothetical protein